MPISNPPATGKFTPLASTVVYKMSAVSVSPRTAVINADIGAGSDTITLTANHAYRFWHDGMNENAYTKVYNTTKGEYAWIKAKPAVNQLQVTNSDDIDGTSQSRWQQNDILSTAEDGAASQYCQVDLSPTVPSTTQAVYCRLYSAENSVVVSFRGTYVRTDSSMNAMANYLQVQNIAQNTYVICQVASGKYIEVRDSAIGVDLLYSIVEVAGYFTE